MLLFQFNIFNEDIIRVLHKAHVISCSCRWQSTNDKT